MADEISKKLNIIIMMHLFTINYTNPIMYKNTKHAKKMWTYATPTLRPRMAGTEAENHDILNRSRRVMTELKLLHHDEFVLNMPSNNTDFTYTRFVNMRANQGFSYLVKLKIPAGVLLGVPVYLLIAPRLGAVLTRLKGKSLRDVPIDLIDLHKYLQIHVFETKTYARPLFSPLAQRVAGSTNESVTKKKEKINGLRKIHPTVNSISTPNLDNKNAQTTLALAFAKAKLSFS